MADHTKIEWTDASWNPIRARNIESGGIGHFCVHASPGCANCYAERMQPRFGNRVRFAAQDVAKVELFLDEHALTQPLRWKKPRMIFVCSMTDLFADFVPDEWIDRVFAVMALCPQHTFQVLTKRSKRMREYMTGRASRVPFGGIGGAAVRAFRTTGVEIESTLPNVWLGVSVEDQRRADERIPDLLATPAAVRWISAEPLLGPLDLGHHGLGVHHHPDNDKASEAVQAIARAARKHLADGKIIDWIVCGGESGPGARPMHPDWARSLRDQCTGAGVPFFFKQWGSWLPDKPFERLGKRGITMRADGSVPSLDDVPQIAAGKFDFTGFQHFALVGKKRAGRLLDGVTHDAFPHRSGEAR